MTFSLIQLKEKSHEQRQPLFFIFIDWTKVFDLVNRKGLIRLLERIRYQPKLLSFITSFHTGMQGTVHFDGTSSKPFPTCSGVKQGCILLLGSSSPSCSHMPSGHQQMGCTCSQDPMVNSSP